MDRENASKAPVREGEILAGKYRVERVLGAGGMGVVVAARHTRLDEPVAIKFLLPAMVLSKDAVARFEREARAAVKIKSEHVARVWDVGTLENGSPYMVMEYLQGSDLSGWLASRGALPVEQAVEFVLQACEALAEAHSLGIVHRDLKPANLFVIRGRDGTHAVKVLDFGISKLLTSEGTPPESALTNTAALMGSPLYMAPEQVRSSKDVDARSDIWSLGVILYELLAGSSPFTAGTLPELLYKILSTEPALLRSARPDAPAGLEAAITRCLAKERYERYGTVEELAMALLPFGSRRARISVERIAGVMKEAGVARDGEDVSTSPEQQATPELGAGTNKSWAHTAARRSRQPRFFAAAAVALLVAAGVLLVGKVRLGSPQAASASPVLASAATPPVVATTSSAPRSIAPPTSPLAGSVTAPPSGAAPAPSTVRAPAVVPVTGQRAPKVLAAEVPTVAATAQRPATFPASPVVPAANCSPNFYFDAKGNKHFKPECF